MKNYSICENIGGPDMVFLVFFKSPDFKGYFKVHDITPHPVHMDMFKPLFKVTRIPG